MELELLLEVYVWDYAIRDTIDLLVVRLLHTALCAEQDHDVFVAILNLH